MQTLPLTSPCPSCTASTWKYAGPTLSTALPSSQARWRLRQVASRNWSSHLRTPRCGRPSTQTVSQSLTGCEESCSSQSPFPSCRGSSETLTLTGTMTLRPACSCSSLQMKVQMGWKAVQQAPFSGETRKEETFLEPWPSCSRCTPGRPSSWMLWLRRAFAGSSISDSAALALTLWIRVCLTAPVGRSSTSWSDSACPLTPKRERLSTSSNTGQQLRSPSTPFCDLFWARVTAFYMDIIIYIHVCVCVCVCVCVWERERAYPLKWVTVIDFVIFSLRYLY